MKPSHHPLPVDPAFNVPSGSADFSDIFSQHTVNAYTEAMAKAQQLVTQFLAQQQKPFSGIHPSKISPAVSEIPIEETLPSYDALFTEVKKIYVDHATAFHLPAYVAHLNCPVVIPALAAEVLISAINSSQDTFDQSAGGTFIETELIKWTARQIGFDADADGVFTAGGSQSNLMGLLLARDHFAMRKYGHNIKKDGNPLAAHRFRFFVSEKAHFSNQKNASLLGLGEKAIVPVACDERFRMIPAALQAAIENECLLGNIPFAVVATAGTTDFGNVDPLHEISQIAKDHGLWLHVDAAYGCGLLLTDKHRHLLRGIEQADSVTIDYHKSFFQPISSSAIIVRHKSQLNIIRHHADYLNPEEQDYEEYPALINKTVTQSTRRFDALKLWFTLRLMGRKKLGMYMDTVIELAGQTAGVLMADKDFELLCVSDISVLVFRFVPPDCPEHERDKLNAYIKKSLFHSGEALLASTRVNDRFYLKFTLLNPLSTLPDICSILDLIKKHAAGYVVLV